MKNHRLHEESLPSKSLHIDEINSALAGVDLGFDVDGPQPVKPMGFGETRVDMAMEDVNRIVESVQSGRPIVEATESVKVFFFRKESFDSLEKMIAAAKDYTGNGKNDRAFSRETVKGTIKVSDATINVWLHDATAADDADDGLVPDDGVYKIVSQTKSDRYFYVNKEGYKYFRYVGVDITQVDGGRTVAAQQAYKKSLADMQTALPDAEAKKLHDSIFIEVRDEMVRELEASVKEMEDDLASRQEAMKGAKPTAMRRLSRDLEASRGSLLARQKMLAIVKAAK